MFWHAQIVTMGSDHKSSLSSLW